MSSIIGRGRYARAVYPTPRRTVPSGGCASSRGYDTISTNSGGVGARRVELTDSEPTFGLNFMFPRTQDVQDDPIRIGDYVMNGSDAIEVTYSVSGILSLFAGPVIAHYATGADFAVALFDVGAGTWSVINGNPNFGAGPRPLGYDTLRAVIDVSSDDNYIESVIKANGTILFVPPAGTYRVGLFFNQVDTSQTGFWVFGGAAAPVELIANVVGADCLLSAVPATLTPATLNAVPFYVPA